MSAEHSIRSLPRVALYALIALFPIAARATPDSAVHARLVLSLAQSRASVAAQPVEVELQAGGEVRRVTAALPGEVAVDVPPGVTYVQVVSDAFWSGSRAFDVRKDGDVLGVEVHPAGVVTGSVTLSDRKEALPAANTIFIGHDRAAPWSKSSTVPCSVAALRWSCVVPAGVHDIRLRVPGYMSAYYWKTAVAAGKRLELGTAKLVRGASLVGTVTADDAPRNARFTVALEPLRLAAVDDEGTTLRIDAVRADERGFFHFDGLAPGMYSVVATLPGYAPARESAQVVAGRESELLTPLQVEKAKTLELAIDPPVAPSGERWTVTIMAKRAGAFHETVTEGAAGQNGLFRWKGARGDYAVDVSSADGKIWKSQHFTIDPESFRVHVSLQPQRIDGIVRLGGRPLRAKLAFDSRDGPEAESDDEGRFSALVPRPDDGVWDITVTSESGGVNREVTVRAPQDGEELLIDLPGARIAGVVVDEQGNGVENAIITIDADRADYSRWTQARSGPGGVFQAGGLAADTYRLSADAKIGRSDNAAVTLAETDDRRIELVLHPDESVRGSVSSPYGPVSSAELYIVPLQGTVTNHLVYTNAAGEFRKSLPPGTEAFDLAVSAPGFARTVFRIPNQKGKLRIDVDQASGTLTIDVPKSFARHTTTSTYLLRGDARIHLGTAQRWGVVQPPSGKDRYTLEVPQMAAGPYRLCATAAGGIENAGPLDPDRCVSGVLAPYGRLTLRLD